MRQRSSGFHGRRVVAAAFIVAIFGWGLGFYGPPVYLETVVRTRGFPLLAVSAAVTTHFLTGALVVANLPALYRRLGLPAVTIGGALLLALGVAGWALARTPAELYAATLLSGAGWPALGAAALNAMVSPWFVRKRPAALSTAYNGASIGGVIFSPLWMALIAWIGFATAALLVGTVMVIIVTGLARGILSHTPAGLGQLPDGEPAPPLCTQTRAQDQAAPLASPWRDPAFLTLALGMALALFAQIGLLAHLVSLLVPRLGVEGAGLAAGLSTAAAILGRQLVGWFMPAGADRRAVAAASLLVQALGCACLASAAFGGSAWLITGVVLVGLGIGNATSLPPLIAQVEFRPADLPRVVALTVALAQATYAFAPATFGLLRATLPEQAIYGVAILVQLCAIAAYMLGRGAHATRRAGDTPVLQAREHARSIARGA